MFSGLIDDVRIDNHMLKSGETVLLDNVAYRAVGFDWNSRTVTAKKNEKAIPLLREPYRSGWDVTL